MKSVLTVEELSYERNNKVLFKQLNFQLFPKQILHIVGANGSGKTTLLQILTGLRIPITGKVMWNGITIEKNNINFTNNLIYVNHRLGMKSALSLTENLYLCLVRRNLIRKQSKRATIHAIHLILDQLDLKDYADTLLTHLSAGQQRRLNLAKLLLIKADCWILDEPFNSLDSAGSVFLSSLMEKQCARGGIIVFSSHQAICSFSLEIKKIFLDVKSC